MNKQRIIITTLIESSSKNFPFILSNHTKEAYLRPQRHFHNRQTWFKGQAYPGAGFIKIISWRSPCKKAFLTSNCHCGQLQTAATTIIIQTVVIFARSAKVSSQSMPYFWLKPCTKRRALYLSGLPLGFISKECTHLLPIIGAPEVEEPNPKFDQIREQVIHSSLHLCSKVYLWHENKKEQKQYRGQREMQKNQSNQVGDRHEQNAEEVEGQE